jgi:RNA polymerase sigma factor (TIGR02999 family)
MSSSSEVTRLLMQWSQGDAAALPQVFPLVYDELRQLARRRLRGEHREHTLAPTALVHEVYLRLVDQRRATWQNRAQFLAVAAQLMRRILVDYARARRARKRGGAATLVSLDSAGDLPASAGTADVLAIDEAVTKLAAHDADQARIVELRFFAGLSVEEIAHVLQRSPRTVKREWRLARAWLYRELHTHGNPNRSRD